jgi:hypothetical protein
LKYVYSIFDRWVNTRSIERHYNIKWV